MKQSRRFFTALAAVVLASAGINVAKAADTLSAGESDSLRTELINRLENIKKLTGVEIKMSARSEFNNQRIIMKAVDSSWNRPFEESEAFTEADVIFEARPVKGIEAKGIIRMRTDWTSFYSHPIDEINSRWLSLGGEPLDWFGFDIGDYHSYYSPLTLSMPQITMAGEPENFRKRRKYEEGDFFILDSLRPLQGMSFDFTPVKKAGLLSINLQGSRLQSVDGIDSRIFDRTMFDRFLFGVRAAYTLPKKGAIALQTVDILDNPYSNFSTRQTKLANTLFGGSAEVDLQGLFGIKPLGELKIFGEFNHAGWKKEWVKTDSPVTSTDMLAMSADQDVADNAFMAGIAAGAGKWIRGDIRFINNGKEYRALGAQAPSVNWAIRDAFISNTYYDRETHFASGLYYSHFGRFATRYNPACMDIYGRSSFNNPRFRGDSLPVSIYSPVDQHEKFTNITLDPVFPLGPATYDRSGVLLNLNGAPINGLSYSIQAALLSNSNGKRFTRGDLGIRFEHALNKYSEMPLTIDAGVGVTKVDDKGTAEHFESDIVVSTLVFHKNLDIAREAITNIMISGGVDIPLWKKFSYFGAVQFLRSTMDYNKTYYGYALTTADTINSYGLQEIATGYTLGQLHFTTGIKLTLSEKAEILFDYRLLNFIPGDASAIQRDKLDYKIPRGATASIESTRAPLDNYEKYKQHLVEILFNFNF